MGRPASSDNQHVVVLTTNCGSITSPDNADDFPSSLQELVTEREYKAKMSQFLQELENEGCQTAGILTALRAPITVFASVSFFLYLFYNFTRFPLFVLVVPLDVVAAFFTKKAILSMRQRVENVFGASWLSQGIKTSLFFGRPRKGLCCLAGSLLPGWVSAAGQGICCLKRLKGSYFHNALFSLEYCLVFEQLKATTQSNANTSSLPVAEAQPLPNATPIGHTSVKSSSASSQSTVSVPLATADLSSSAYDRTPTGAAAVEVASARESSHQQQNITGQPGEASYSDQMMKDLERP
jgi:hypothetical protein